MPTHKKGQDRDKYYQLAKDQGYRSRAAFKLIQINKRYDFLRKSKVCIDLCAAPGGWCQVAAKFMPVGSIVLGVDLLPIKPLRGVKSIVGDITTAQTRKNIMTEINGWKADVVLCDGAPNIGSAYSKDAYVQNELVLAALKTATEHLVKGGVFCTKVYRSVDYNSVVWVLQQLFEDVQTMKPNSSRSQSSEIFLVCMGYIAPKTIDPKIFDPNQVFKEVADPSQRKPDVLHKKADSSYKRQRTGYDDSLGITLRSSATVSQFVDSKEPVRVLSDVNAIVFSDDCAEYLRHPKTSEEVKLALSDLKVLGKIDFKKLLKWRQQLIDTLHPKDENKSEDKEDEQQVQEDVDPEMQIQQEIEDLRMKSQLDADRADKKMRKLARKERERQKLGINASAFDVDHDQELFRVPDNTTFEDLEQLAHVDLDATDEAVGKAILETVEEEEAEFAQANRKRKRRDEDEEALLAEDENNVVMEDEDGMIYVQHDLEDELDTDYNRFMAKRSAKLRNNGVAVKDKREIESISEKKMRMKDTAEGKIKSLQSNDDEVMNKAMKHSDDDEDDEGAEGEDLKAYLRLLGKDKASDESSEESSSEDDDSEEEEEDKVAAAAMKVQSKARQLVVTHDEPTLEHKTGQWFSNPIFASSLLNKAKPSRGKKAVAGKDEDDESEPEGFDYMPKTDKEKRREKRKKEQERRERRESRQDAAVEDDSGDELGGAAKQAKKVKKVAGVGVQDFEIVPANHDGSFPAVVTKKAVKADGETEGDVATDSDGGDSESGSEDEKEDLGLPQRMDDREYDSDHEDYDHHDKVMTLALGTYMLRNSRKKALVDASYNRFAWNDPTSLPSWFLDDEMRHNKPQVPVPNALVEQIKNKYQLTGTKVIKKVAEARLRKKKRAVNKLKAAKKAANLMAENSELTEKQKLKAIAKATNKFKGDKPSKVYITTRKTKAGSMGTSGKIAKGSQLKFVDKRLRKDMRATKAQAKKNGGKNKRK